MPLTLKVTSWGSSVKERKLNIMNDLGKQVLTKKGVIVSIARTFLL